MFKKILVPVDGSKHADQAVDVAIDLAKHYDASIRLIHVIRNLALPKEILAMIAQGEITESRMELLQNSAELILESALDRCARAGLTEVDAEYELGDPASTIANYAQEHHIDLIVLGAQGLETQPNLLGGVARKLTNITDIACLLVR